MTTSTAILSKRASAMFKKLQALSATHGDRAFLAFSLKAKVSVYAAWELQQAGLVVSSPHPNNEVRIELKSA